MTTETKVRSRMGGLGAWRSLLLTLPALLFSTILISQGQIPSDPLQRVAMLITWLLFNGSFFLMLFSGKTHRYRSFLFILMSFALIVWFATTVMQERGNIALTEENVINGEVPFCHLVIPMILIPAAFTRTIIFPGSLLSGFAPIASMVVIWLGVSLATGRGWCSWACFYGGLDECCSRLAKKPLLKHIDRKWTYLPYAVLLGVVLTSAATLTPTYCEWLCPFKAVTEYAAVTSTLALIQTIIFVALFAGLVVVLPLLTKRRTQCGLFCPLGALQSLFNKINIFELRIDTEKCTHCKRCIQSCPTFSLDEGSLESGHPLISCTKCGQCVDLCPKGAISYHIKGTSLHASPQVARLLFLYPAFFAMTALGGGMTMAAIWRILKWIATGSML